jgi:hypothetical protein
MEYISSAYGRMIGLQIQNGEYRSGLRPIAEQLRHGFDHAFAMPEQPVTVAADKVDLVLAAFLPNRLEVFDGLRSGHFRYEFGPQVSFRSGPVERFTAGEHDLLKNYFLCAEREIQSLRVGFGYSRRGIGR